MHAYLNSLTEKNLDNMRTLPNGTQVTCPVWEYDVVYQLVYVYEHFISRGGGLRQIMDFHFFLLNKPQNADLVKDAMESIGVDVGVATCIRSKLE